MFYAAQFTNGQQMSVVLLWWSKVAESEACVIQRNNISVYTRALLIYQARIGNPCQQTANVFLLIRPIYFISVKDRVQISQTLMPMISYSLWSKRSPDSNVSLSPSLIRWLSATKLTSLPVLSHTPLFVFLSSPLPQLPPPSPHLDYSSSVVHKGHVYPCIPVAINSDSCRSIRAINVRPRDAGQSCCY